MNQCPKCGTPSAIDPTAQQYCCPNSGCTMDTWRPCECGQYIDELPDILVHCFWHHKNEPVPVGGAYQICGECQHVYASAAALVAAYNDAARRFNDGDIDDDGPVALRSLAEADDIYFCQFCIHDF